MLMQCCRDSGQASVSTRPQKAITACRGSSSILAERGLRPTSSLVASIVLVFAAERPARSLDSTFCRPKKPHQHRQPSCGRCALSIIFLPIRSIILNATPSPSAPTWNTVRYYLPNCQLVCEVTPRETRDCRFWLRLKHYCCLANGEVSHHSHAILV
jgi:hypothetical protein